MILDRTIYLVRHGETVLNAARIKQSSEGLLSDNGVLQVEATALRLANFNIKKIYSSPFERAVQTSNIIKSIIDTKNTITIEYSDLLAERRNPTSIIGVSYDDQHTTEAVNFMDKSFHEADARLEDEENFIDLKTRALALQKFIADNAKDKSLFVSHGIFLKMFLSVCIYGKDLSVENYIKLSVFNPAENAGLTVIKYSPIKVMLGGNGWQVLAYNDGNAAVPSASV